MALNKINIKSITLPPDKNVESVDYQVSTTPQFLDVDIIESVNVTTGELFSRTFDLDYTIQDMYYARVKINFTDGSFYGWTKPIAVTKSGDGYSHNNIVIVTPKVQISTDVDNAELGGWYITTSKFVTFTGNGYHKYSNWFIKDTNGNVIWKRERDKHNLTKIRIPSNILEPGKVYNIEVTFVSDSNIPSNAGKLTFKTNGRELNIRALEYSGLVTLNGTADYNNLEDAYTYLLEFAVDNLALGNTVPYTQ